MPTAARLAAALGLSLTAFVASYFLRQILPDRMPAQFLYPVNVLIGFAVGWIVVGKRVGQNYAASISYSVTGGVVMVFWILLVHSAGRMWILSLRKAYKYPPDALNGMLDEFLNYAIYLTAPSIFLPLIVGSVLTGVIAENVGKRYS